MRKSASLTRDEVLALRRKKYKHTTGEWLCILLLCAPALIHLLVFWLGVQVETFRLAFTDHYTQRVGWYNFQWAFEQLSGASAADIPLAFENTIKFFVMGCLLIPVSMFFAYLIYRKSFGHGFMRVSLYLPGAIGGIMISLLYARLMMYDGPLMHLYSQLTGSDPVMLSSENGILYIMIHDVLIGVGANLMIWLGGMSRIPYDLIEVGKLEGIGPFTEFRKVILPLIWPTFVTMFTLQIINIFGSSGSILALTGGADGTNTLAFWMYNMVLQGLSQEYGNVSALGLIFTVVTIPIVVIGRWFMNKFGEEVEY